MKSRGSQVLSLVSWIASGAAELALVYFATAPPVMMGIIKRFGFSSEAPGLMLYLPVVRLLESDFGGPLLWYFNRVWHADVQFFGKVNYGPFYVMLAYAFVAALCVSTAALPFVRRYRKRA